MPKRRVPERGDLYWVNPNPTAGDEMKDMHPFIVITPKEINQLGVCMTVPVTTGGKFSREMGLTVVISSSQTVGVAVCHQVRSFDLEARVKQGSAQYIETLDSVIINDIVDRVVSVIDPVA